MDHLNLLKSDTYRELEPVRSDDKLLDKIVKQLKKETDIEKSYKDFLLSLLTKEESFIPCKRKREKYECNHEVNDPQYELFLQNLEIYKKTYVLKHKKNNSCLFIKYGGDSDLYENDSIGVSLEKGSIINLETHSEMHSDFRKELMCILRKPFDRDEYNKLRNDVEIHKAAVRHRELRNGRDKECFTNKPGKSYLDLYPGRLKILEFLFWHGNFF